MVEQVLQHLRANLELGGAEIFFDEPLQFSTSRPSPAPKVAPASLAPQKAENRIDTAKLPGKDTAAPALSLLTPTGAKPVLSGFEDLKPIEGATTLEAFHEAVMHHPFYRLGAGKAGRIAYGVGPLHPPLMLIGFSPSEEDLKTGGFYTGASSELLRKLLESLSHSRNLCYATWLVKKPMSSSPLPRQISMLRKMLQVEVNLVKPEIVLMLGEQTFQACMGTNALLQTAGGNAMEFAGAKATAIFDPLTLNEFPGLKAVTWKQHLPKSGFFRQAGL